VLHFVAVWCVMMCVLHVHVVSPHLCSGVLQCVAVCCSVLQGVAVCFCVTCNDVVLQVHISPHLCCSVLQCVAVCCSVLQCVAVCSSV